MKLMQMYPHAQAAVSLYFVQFALIASQENRLELNTISKVTTAWILLHRVAVSAAVWCSSNAS
jgi:hypothetical protein